MIEIKLSFNSVEEAIAYLQREPTLGGAERPLTDADAKADIAGKSRPSRAVKAETASPTVAVDSSPQETVAASPASSPEVSASAPAAIVEYSVLQKAVFTLAGKSREAAASVAAGLGVKTFKELPAERWNEALDAVNAKIAEAA